MLKNAGSTYQMAMTTLFHDMMHRKIEVYVDDMIELVFSINMLSTQKAPIYKQSEKAFRKTP